MTHLQGPFWTDLAAETDDPTTTLPDLNFFTHVAQIFPRWTWEPVDDEPRELGTEGELVDGHRRIDNVADEALRRCQAAYGTSAGSTPDWTKDDVFFYCYGLLHSPDYRERYAADLKQVLPRMPLVAEAGDARAFADSGRALCHLHAGCEAIDPYPLSGLEHPDAPTGEAAYDFFAVGTEKMRFGMATAEQRAAGERRDASTIHYNDRITVSGVPVDAHRYILGSRSAVEWVLDRYHVNIDKASGVVNDPNDWSRELGEPRYILDLLARVVRVSVETMRIVDALPHLHVREQQDGVK